MSYLYGIWADLSPRQGLSYAWTGVVGKLSPVDDVKPHGTCRSQVKSDFVDVKIGTFFSWGFRREPEHGSLLPKWTTRKWRASHSQTIRSGCLNPGIRHSLLKWVLKNVAIPIVCYVCGWWVSQKFNTRRLKTVKDSIHWFDPQLREKHVMTLTSLTPILSH